MIGSRGGRQKSFVGLAVLLLAGCAGPAIVESTPMAVTIRYSAADGIEGAAQLAQRACAAHTKTAQFRSSANFGVIDRYAHFDCI